MDSRAFNIGHSKRSWDVFISLQLQSCITIGVNVRQFFVFWIMATIQ
jgi:hypothetical protein